MIGKTDKVVKELLATDFTVSGTGVEPRFLDPDLDDVRVFDIDLIEATTRQFVSDLPWWERFLIWLFPRMYDIREYNP